MCTFDAYLSFFFAELFSVYAFSAGFSASVKIAGVIKWQGEDIPEDPDDRGARGTGIAIINPLTDDYEYRKFDTIENDGVSLNVF